MVFRAAGFTHSSSTCSSSLANMDIIVEAGRELNNSDNSLQQLDTLLTRLHIGGLELIAAEFVYIDSAAPTFNGWDDYEHLKTYIKVTEDNNEEEEEEETLVGQPPNVSQAVEMIRKFHLFASIEQPQLHNLISDVESQLTDIYPQSNAVKQNSITDYFSHC